MSLQLDLIIRILVAGLLGGVVGFERGRRAKEAGIRTHFLVAVGSAIFMVISQYGFPDAAKVDAARIAAQVVSGIGFLGAGLIVFQKQAVKGLTTAAGLWVTASIGLCCGAGMYLIAVVGTLLVLVCLDLMNYLLRRFGKRSLALTLTAKDKDDLVKMLDFLRESFYNFGDYSIKKLPDGKIQAEVTFRVRKSEHDAVMKKLIEEMDDVSIDSID